MYETILRNINRELRLFIGETDNLYSLRKISPLLYASIREFALRGGKRVRPTLFVIGYLGYAEAAPPGLYRSAVALELLHDFMLVHDDIIDKSETRRGKPSMHMLLQAHIGRRSNVKFTGEDLAIVAGDVMYAMALGAFLAVEEDKSRKEAALRKLIEAALYTGSGEFIELIYGLKENAAISRNEIYRIYDLKTAQYTFSYPLTIGATLAGAPQRRIEPLFRYGIYLGRAFQIKDDILGMFGDERKTGKSTLCDIQEAKKTILIWCAHNRASKRQKAMMRAILTKTKPIPRDLAIMRDIVTDTGSLDYARNEIVRLLTAAHKLHEELALASPYKESLDTYIHKLFSV